MNTIGLPAVSETRREARDQQCPRILSICCVFPNPSQPDQGLFVQRRLQHLGALAHLWVVAPVAVLQYGNPRGRKLNIGKRAYPTRRQDGNLTVLQPRWFYPPLSGSLISLWLSLRLCLLLRQIRKEFAFDVIDTHFGFPEGIAGAILSLLWCTPFTVTLRGNEPKHSRSLMGRWAMSWAVRKASRVFTVSERLRKFAIELGAPATKVKTIANGVDPVVFYPRNKNESRIRHGLPLDCPIIVSAGALVERKGHHRIIKALASMRAHGSKAQLVIAGGAGPEGQFENNLRNLVYTLGLGDAVHFLGPRPAQELAEVMSAADVFCLASTNEGWPNVVHEALACGVPVVATDVGAVPEMLGGNSPGKGSCGLTVPVNNPAMLQEALEQALQSGWDRAAISEWGRSRTWRAVAAEVREEMEQIVRKQANI